MLMRKWHIQCLGRDKTMDNYYNVDFGKIEGTDFHVDGYVYYAGEPNDKPYRAVQFCGCYIPLDKRDDPDYIDYIESECKQYIENISEEQAKEYIEWYLSNCEPLKIFLKYQ